MHHSSTQVTPLFVYLTTPTTPDHYTLSLHDALPISALEGGSAARLGRRVTVARAHRLLSRGSDPRDGRRAQERGVPPVAPGDRRSEEHTSELQSRSDLVCRLLLEKKKTKTTIRLSVR